MHEAVRDVEPARSIARRPAPRAGMTPPLLGVPQGRRAPLPPPRRTDPREALRAAKAPASARTREPYLIATAAFAAAGAIALALFSSYVVGLPFRSAAPATAEAELSVTAVEAAREARELRQLPRTAAAAARAEDKSSKESGPASSGPQTSDEPSSPGSGKTAGNEDDPALLDDTTALVEDSANELEGATNPLREDSATLLEETTEPLLEEAESLELDASLP